MLFRSRPGDNCDHGDREMTALWVAPTPSPGAPGLCLVDAAAALPEEVDGSRDLGTWSVPLSVVPERRATPRPRRRTSPAVRRRRTLLAVMGLLLLGLALPLSGTGGHSHTTGSALAGNGGVVTYTVRPGDTLWSIAERLDPASDPRPLMVRLATQTGSDTVVPGEQIVLP